MSNPKPQRCALKKNLYGGLIAQRAFDQVCMLCRFVQQNNFDDRHPMFASFMAAICVIYSRPFTSNEFFGPLRKTYSCFSDPELKRTHDNVLSSRNQLYAHTDGSKAVLSPDRQLEEPLHQLLVVVEHEQTPQGQLVRYHVGVSEVNLRAINLPNIVQACEEIQRKLNEEKESIQTLLFQEKVPKGSFLKPGLHRFRLDDES